jgi:hypothetical protein
MRSFGPITIARAALRAVLKSIKRVQNDSADIYNDFHSPDALLSFRQRSEMSTAFFYSGAIGCLCIHISH